MASPAGPFARSARILPPPISTAVSRPPAASRPGVQPNNDAMSGSSTATIADSAWFRLAYSASEASSYASRLYDRVPNVSAATSTGPSAAAFLASELESEHVYPRFFLPPSATSLAPSAGIVSQTGMSIRASRSPPDRSTSLDVPIPPPILAGAVSPATPAVFAGLSPSSRYRAIVQDVLGKLELPQVDEDDEDEEPSEHLVDTVGGARRARAASGSSTGSRVFGGSDVHPLVKTRPRRHSVEKQPALV